VTRAIDMKGKESPVLAKFYLRGLRVLRQRTLTGFLYGNLSATPARRCGPTRAVKTRNGSPLASYLPP
jgi:hypothetical protein